MSGTDLSIRHALELSITTAPASTAIGAYSRLIAPPAEETVASNHERSPRREVRAQPEETVHGREPRFSIRRSVVGEVVGAEEGSGQRGRPVQDLSATALSASSEGGLEELTDDPVRELALEFAAAGVEDVHPGLPPPLARSCEQTCLADAGAPLDQDEASGSAARRLDERTKLGEFALTLEQIGCCRQPAPFGDLKS